MVVAALAFYQSETDCVNSMVATDGTRFTENISDTYDRFCPCADVYLCRCGEVAGEMDWSWDPSTASAACNLVDDNTEAHFHGHYSRGTACCRSSDHLAAGSQHYFEVKILDTCYGTDIMIGVGTDKADLRKYESTFVSMLGSCNQTWGLSYRGEILHDSKRTKFRSGFRRGNIVGVHVDLWRGQLSYYINRKPIGVAFTNLGNKPVYAMICSTAARSRFRLITARSYKTDLLYWCCNSVKNTVPNGQSMLPLLTPLPPSLKFHLDENLHWFLIGSALPTDAESQSETPYGSSSEPEISESETSESETSESETNESEEDSNVQTE